jgi:DNA-binding NtrC family response regulator
MPSKRRLSFLLVEKDEDGLSPRKILIEAAKHNVITAYSPAEGLATFRRFANVDAIAIDARFGDEVCSAMTDEVKKTHPNIKIVAFMSTEDHECRWADFRVEPHDPKSLLDVLIKMNGNTQTG